MNTPKIIIEVSGGLVNNIISDRNIDVIILDHDNLKEGERTDIARYRQDSILTEGYQDNYISQQLSKYQITDKP